MAVNRFARVITSGEVTARVDRLWRLLAITSKKSEGKDWQEVAGKLARIGRWELEDYTPELVSLAGTVFPTNLDPPQW